MKTHFTLEEYQSLFLLGINNQADSELLKSALTHPTQMAVYENNHRQTLLTCLATTFIKTKLLLTPARFETLADLYVQRTPSISENLNEYGEDFGTFLAEQLATEELGLVIDDVAQYDFLKQVCYYAANAVDLVIEDFLTLSLDEQMRSSFVKKSSIFIFKSKVDFNALEEGEVLQVNDKSGYYLLYRNQGKVKLMLIDEQIFLLLTLFNKSKALEELDAHELEVLPQILAQGWLVLAPSGQP